MVVGAKVCELTDGFLWFVCGLYVGILTSPLNVVELTRGGIRTIHLSHMMYNMLSEIHQNSTDTLTKLRQNRDI